MTHSLPPAARRDLLSRGYSRRAFGRVATLLGAGAASVPFYNEPALAQLSMIGQLPPDAVRINANENPLGPCPEALAAVMEAARDGGRYRYMEAFQFARVLAESENVPPEYVKPFAGSSDPLHRSVLAFTSPSRSFVCANPGYEAGAGAARFAGAEVIPVPLTKQYAHDVRAMHKAAPNAGLFYICNPNNPTGTLTDRDDIYWLVQNKPGESIVLVDEAYIHISKSALSCVDLVRGGADVVVLRTFSKLYGMAGLRAGAAIARPDLLDKLSRYGPGILPVTGMVGATASLKVKNLVEQRRQIIGEIRENTFEFLREHGYPFVPSESNKFMLDVKRPGREVIQALAVEKVYVGRVWPSWPTHIRVSIGTPEEMAKFRSALLRVLPPA